MHKLGSITLANNARQKCGVGRPHPNYTVRLDVHSTYILDFGSLLDHKVSREHPKWIFLYHDFPRFDRD